jgi:hypothetical protein
MVNRLHRTFSWVFYIILKVVHDFYEDTANASGNEQLE